MLVSAGGVNSSLEFAEGDVRFGTPNDQRPKILTAAFEEAYVHVVCHDGYGQVIDQRSTAFTVCPTESPQMELYVYVFVGRSNPSLAYRIKP